MTYHRLFEALLVVATVASYPRLLASPVEVTATATGPVSRIACAGEDRGAWLAEWRERFLELDLLARTAVERLGPPASCVAEATGELDGASFGRLTFRFQDGSRLTVETWPPETSRVALALSGGFAEEDARGLLARYAKSIGLEIDWSAPSRDDEDGQKVITYQDGDEGLNAIVRLVYESDRLVEIGLSMAL